MNEFIVWDKRDKKFITNGVSVGIKLMSDEGIIIFDEYERYSSDNIKDFEVCNYIGKTDDTPEQNKIYADCSIVEFELTREVISGNITHEVTVIKKGIFTYNRELCCFEIKTSKPFQDIYSLCLHEIKNLKVIGTIQENPESLNV